MSGQLCLKWNNHSNAFEKLLNNLHLKEMYSDATIVCHGKFYPVHRFVLSTCSEYFEEMFEKCGRMNNKLPFIIVKDINPIQIEALLNYMYRGEVNVPQEMLPDLIKAAEAFKIKGLAVPDEEPPPKSKKRPSVSSPVPVSKKSRRHDERSSRGDRSDLNNEINHSDRLSDSSNSQIHASSKPSQSSSKSNLVEDIYIQEPELAPVKSEPIDPTEIPIEDNNPKNENNLKSEPEQSFETFTEGYDPYNENDPNNIGDGFDPAQSSSWDNSQDFDPGDQQQLEGDPSQRIRVIMKRLPAHASTNLNERKEFKVFQCKVCLYETHHRMNCIKHAGIHSADKPFKCPCCSYSSSDRSNFRRHVTKCSDILEQIRQ